MADFDIAKELVHKALSSGKEHGMSSLREYHSAIPLKNSISDDILNAVKGKKAIADIVAKSKGKTLETLPKGLLSRTKHLSSLQDILKKAPSTYGTQELKSKYLGGISKDLFSAAKKSSLEKATKKGSKAAAGLASKLMKHKMALGAGAAGVGAAGAYAYSKRKGKKMEKKSAHLIQRSQYDKALALALAINN